MEEGELSPLEVGAGVARVELDRPVVIVESAVEEAEAAVEATTSDKRL